MGRCAATTLRAASGSWGSAPQALLLLRKLLHRIRHSHKTRRGVVLGTTGSPTGSFCPGKNGSVMRSGEGMGISGGCGGGAGTGCGEGGSGTTSGAGCGTSAPPRRTVAPSKRVVWVWGVPRKCSNIVISMGRSGNRCTRQTNAAMLGTRPQPFPLAALRLAGAAKTHRPGAGGSADPHARLFGAPWLSPSGSAWAPARPEPSAAWNNVGKPVSGTRAL